MMMETTEIKMPITIVQYKNKRKLCRLIGKCKMKENNRKLHTAIKKINPKTAQP